MTAKENEMTKTKAAAIAASAYNVCGPRDGSPATPSNVGNLRRTDVVRFLGLYLAAHDGSLYTRAEIDAARDLLAA
jgi:hypothetical protein